MSMFFNAVKLGIKQTFDFKGTACKSRILVFYAVFYVDVWSGRNHRRSHRRYHNQPTRSAFGQLHTHGHG